MNVMVKYKYMRNITNMFFVNFSICLVSLLLFLNLLQCQYFLIFGFIPLICAIEKFFVTLHGASFNTWIKAFCEVQIRFEFAVIQLPFLLFLELFKISAAKEISHFIRSGLLNCSLVFLLVFISDNASASTLLFGIIS